MYILGLSCWYHDSAACLVQDGRLVAAAQEERFTRRKHDPDFPTQAIDYCLSEAGISVADLDAVAFYDKPFLKFERLLETYVSYAPHGFPSFLKAMPLWLKRKLWIPDLIEKELGYEGDLFFPEHHESHAASAFFPSPFEEAAVLTTDGVGEWTTTSFGVGHGNDLTLLAEQHFPHSLGLLYSAFTYFCGFRVNSGEYKLMGLAPYGEPIYEDIIRRELIDIRDDGSFRLHMKRFNYAAGLTMTGRGFDDLFGGPRRAPESPLSQREMDLARSVQAVTEDVVLKMARHAHRETGLDNLCMAGGVALNCVANGRLVREGPFKNVWLQPAAGDAGGAVGAALATWHMAMKQPRETQVPDAMQGTYLGPQFGMDAIREAVADAGIPAAAIHESTGGSTAGDLVARTAAHLAEGRVAGWFSGRMEFGPRALGGRSILADPRGREVQRTVNLKIKYRESFRPFAPSVTAEAASDWFDLDTDSPYMLLVAQVRNATIGGEGLDRLHHIDSPVPAVTHVDGSARIQTVTAEQNPRYHALLKAFERLTGCPMLVNTSFNVRGEPIVCTPADAIRCFLDTHMDVLVLEDMIIDKRLIPGAMRDMLTAEEVAAKYGLD